MSSEINGKRCLVIGLGISGFKAAQLLSTEGVFVKVSDNGFSSDIKYRAGILNDKYGIQTETGGHTKEFCSEADLIITSPGVDLRSLYENNIISRNIPVISELELGFRFCRAPVVAITGTNGKTTTTELIGRILKASGMDTIVCGNIGNPLCGEIENIKEESIVVIEVSSFQLDHIEEFSPFIGVLLNVAEDHFERYGGYEGYKRSKFNLFKNQTEVCWSLFFSDFINDPLIAGLKSNIEFFGPGEVTCKAELDNIYVRSCSGEKLFMNSGDIKLEGIHNMYNVAAAVSVSKILDVPDHIIREVVSSFSPPAHRFEKLGSINGVEYIDDSKATNIDATRVALESLNKKVLLIAGGIDKGGDYNSIRSLVIEKVKAIILIGEAREVIAGSFCDAVRIVDASTMEEAVTLAAYLAEPGEIVMLSPMCSSFDMFPNYKKRGEVFRAAVEKLSKDLFVSNQ